MKEAYFAGGCFWCISSVYTSLDGVKDVVSGFSGGKEINPKYEDVKNQLTHHRETIKIIYEEDKVSYSELIKIFFDNVDPFDDGGQFIDRGHSYTLAIYYKDNSEKEIACSSIERLEQKSRKKVYISVEPFDCFYEAEEYHQKYHLKNPEEFNEEMEKSGRKRK